MSEEEKKEGLVRDLAEKVNRGELRPEEAKKEVLKRGLRYAQYKPKHRSAFILLTTVGIVLCYLPLAAKLTGWGVLNSFAQLPSVDFPLIAKIFVAAFFIPLFAVNIYAVRLRRKEGGTRDKHETVILVKKGPYAIMRHPEELPWALLLLLLTIVPSGFIPFTPLSVIGNVLFFGGFYFEIKGEDGLNVLKWGDRYRQYEKEVPMFNFVLGAWRWVRRKDRKP